LTPESREILKWSARILVLASLGWCIGCDIYRLFWVQEPSRAAFAYSKWDSWLENALEPGRGIFLDFSNFPMASAGFAQDIYFHGVYVLFPRRVLVSDPGLTINSARDILPNNTYPNERWLLDWGIGSVMSIEMDPKQKLPVVKHVHWLGE